jgi:hypothetical protein
MDYKIEYKMFYLLAPKFIPENIPLTPDFQNGA